MARCNAKQVHLGEPYLYRGLLPPWILNFPTQEHWRSVSRLSDIVAGLEYLERHYPAHIGLAEILARIEREPYHWPVGRITFQKIAYFATALGLPTGLHFVRGSYGPFSPDLHPLITRLVNNGLIQEVQLGRMFAVKPGPTYGDAANAFRAELTQWEPLINRITDLFLRMRTQEAEVAATVHFTAQALDHGALGTVSEAAVLEGVKHWKQRRHPPLNDEEIAQAIRDLNLLGWIKAKPSSELPLAQDAALLEV